MTTSNIEDPLLTGLQPCGNCGKYGMITWDFDTGYKCWNCGKSDSDE